MKKKLRLLFVLCLFPTFVYAKGSASISGPSTVENGGKVTISVTLKNVAAWDIEIKSSGSTSGCSNHFADATETGKNTTKTFSVTCKATSVGSIGFTASGDITSADGENSEVDLSKRVTVTKPREKATDANLASLFIEGFTLTPEFDKETLEYMVTVPSTVDKIKLDAKVNESHASLEGTGEFEVTEGVNTFEVVCTAENGTKKTYVVTVNVLDTDPIEVKIGDNQYTIIKNSKNLTKPENYEETTITIDGFTIPAFHSEITGFTLVGLKSMEGKIDLAIYNNNTYVLYNEIKATVLNLYLTDFDKEISGYIKSTLMINDMEVPIYKYNEDSRYVICYGMNLTTGKYDYYSYDTKEGTFQNWNQEEKNDLNNKMKNYQYICISFGIGLFFAFILILYLLKKKKKPKKEEEHKQFDRS